MTQADFELLLDEASHAVMAVLERNEVCSATSVDTADCVNDALEPILKNLTDHGLGS